MRSTLENFHPITLFLYFIAIVFINVFTNNPVISIISLITSLLLCIKLSCFKNLIGDIVFYLFLLILISLTNPMFSHNGQTILFFMNDNPITLESLLCGVNIGVMIISVLFWCNCFNKVFGSDKIIYLFGKITPKLALVMSITLHFIPTYKSKYKELSIAQKGLGLYSDESKFVHVINSVKVFFSLITWSIESSIDTANSMKARGNELKHRTSFSIYKLRKIDTIVILITIIVFLSVIINSRYGFNSYEFYPTMSILPMDLFSLLCYFGYGVLCFLPLFYLVKEDMLWNYYVSKI